MRLMAARVRVAEPATGFLVGRWLCVPYQQTNLPGQ